jgi:hypothetical protein
MRKYAVALVFLLVVSGCGGSEAATSEEAVAPITRQWVRFESVNPIDDTSAVSARLIANEKVTVGTHEVSSSDLSHEVSLILLCTAQGQMIVALWINGANFDTDFLVKDDNQPPFVRAIRLRFDDQDPYVVEDIGRPPGEDFILTRLYPPEAAEESVNDIVNKILNATTLLLELTPMDSAKQHVSFDLDGLAPFLPELRSRCNW